ncbi:serine O-acetyltransferase [Asticcacaulis sp. AND118]|uniref:serine O-acetyltransferase n=1 Tax=Asticcacaulis sp. AND118 TaxID=2840468 RepID=UPI00351CDC0D
MIGDSVTIYQNVTLGIAKESQRAYPQIEDGVTIYAGAILLGGIRVGRGSIVAAGAIVTKDVPPHSLAIGAPARVRPLA